VGSIDEGIIITAVEGLHAGLNSISGDFSLAAKGFLIQAGQQQQPVNQITVSGNFYQMIKDIVAVGNDIRFKLPSSQSCFGSPSVVIDQLTISGE
jgi:PmbA protein